MDEWIERMDEKVKLKWAKKLIKWANERTKWIQLNRAHVSGGIWILGGCTGERGKVGGINVPPNHPGSAANL